MKRKEKGIIYLFLKNSICFGRKYAKHESVFTRDLFKKVFICIFSKNMQRKVEEGHLV